MKSRKFPKDFYWGVTTASHHIEEGNSNDWTEWEKTRSKENYSKAKIKFRHLLDIDYFVQKFEENNSFISGDSRMSFSEYKRDIDYIHSLGLNSYRFSLEWSRIEKSKGKFDEEALLNYRKIIQYMISKNITPFVTLWHFSSPIWFQKSGGWKKDDCTEHFLEYVSKVEESLGDIVSNWITINESDIYCRMVYLTGSWLEERNNVFLYQRAFRNFIRTHNRTYQLLKSRNCNYSVGYASHFTNIEFKLFKPFDKFLSHLTKELVNMRFIKQTMKHTDWIGVNHYHNVVISWKGLSMDYYNNPNDLGWGIYPPAIYQILLDLKYINLPIIITENGIADYNDQKRAEYISKYVEQVYRAIKEGVDVKGYFYFTLMDNFEWSDGYIPHFGLAGYDSKKHKFIPRKSSTTYSKIAKSNSI